MNRSQEPNPMPTNAAVQGTGPAQTSSSQLRSFAIALIFMAALGDGCKSKDAPAPQPEVTVQAEHPELGPMAEHITADPSSRHSRRLPSRPRSVLLSDVSTFNEVRTLKNRSAARYSRKPRSSGRGARQQRHLHCGGSGF